MELDESRIDDTVLALLYLGLHDGARAWKGFDWDAMDRLYEAGMITDPSGARELGRVHRGGAGAIPAVARRTLRQTRLTSGPSCPRKPN